MITRLVKAFLMFWWDFLVGDTPELFIGIVLILGILFLVPMHGITGPMVMVGLVVFTTAVSLWVELRRKVRQNSQH